MSERAEGSKGEKKGKKKHINKPTSEKWKKYTLKGDSVHREKNCPRCGAGIFLAVHKGRLSCGKCKYTEFTK
jgi:small subunit ribosomal protein S27Ae